MTNPIHQEQDGQWYFWDETWADRYGPFSSEEETREKLQQYAKWLNDGESPSFQLPYSPISPATSL